MLTFIQESLWGTEAETMPKMAHHHFANETCQHSAQSGRFIKQSLFTEQCRRHAGHLNRYTDETKDQFANNGGMKNPV